MKTKILCLVISFITCITLASCKAKQPVIHHDDEPHNTIAVDSTTPSPNPAKPSVNTSTPPADVPAAVSDAFIAACNMNAGGYVNFANGKYYYTDAAHDNNLYMCDADGKNALCIDTCADEIISCITVDDRAAYYLKRRRLDTPLEYNNSSVTYTVLFEGQLCRYGDGQVTVLSEENVLSYALSNDYLFYTTADLQVYRIRHDGTEKTAIYELRNPMSLCVSENKLYAHRDEEVISMDFDGKNPISSRVYLYAPAVNISTMYYININDFSLCKTDLYGAQVHTVIDEEIKAFNVYNGQFVYQPLSSDKIMLADINGENPKVVCTGKSPIVLNGYLFYLDNGVIRVADI